MIVFGTPTWVDDLLGYVVVQIRTATGMPKDVVFESLARDEDHLLFPPADRFVTCGGLRFPVDQPGVAGAGRFNTGFNGQLKITAFCRLATDQELRHTNALRDRSKGALQFVKGLISALQQFKPLTPDGTGCYLREPMRLADGGFEVLPKSAKDGSAWVAIPSYWSCKFTMPLTTP